MHWSRSVWLCVWVMVRHWGAQTLHCVRHYVPISCAWPFKATLCGASVAKPTNFTDRCQQGICSSSHIHMRCLNQIKVQMHAVPHVGGWVAPKGQTVASTRHTPGQCQASTHHAHAMHTLTMHTPLIDHMLMAHVFLTNFSTK